MSMLHSVCSRWKGALGNVPVAHFAAAAKRKKKGLRIKKRNDHTYLPDIAIRLVKALATARFDETIDIALQLGVDPRKPGQNIRGVAMLPHGTGKRVSVAVFARGEKAEEARRAGADIVGAEDLVESITRGELPFTKAVATPDVMPLVGRVARILGPRGLMPNPKLGTVTMDVAQAVQSAKRGLVEFRTERQGIVHASLGKSSFSDAQLLENLRAFMLAVNEAKTDSVKGQFMRHATLSSTMGRGVHVDIAALDPSRGTFLQCSDHPGAPPQIGVAKEGLPKAAQIAAEAAAERGAAARR